MRPLYHCKRDGHIRRGLLYNSNGLKMLKNQFYRQFVNFYKNASVTSDFMYLSMNFKCTFCNGFFYLSLILEIYIFWSRNPYNILCFSIRSGNYLFFVVVLLYKHIRNPVMLRLFFVIIFHPFHSLYFNLS